MKTKERDKYFPSTGSLLKWPQWLALHQAKARSFIRASQVGEGEQALGSSSAALQTPVQGVGSELEQQGLQLVPVCEAGITDGDVTCSATVPAPELNFRITAFISVAYFTHL